MQFSLSALLLTLTAVSAAPTSSSSSSSPVLETRAPATCGGQYYSSAQVNAASVAACNHFRSGTTAGGSSYPHRYNNYEGFHFNGYGGPFQEFPIIPGGVYTGGECCFPFPFNSIRLPSPSFSHCFSKLFEVDVLRMRASADPGINRRLAWTGPCCHH